MRKLRERLALAICPWLERPANGYVVFDYADPRVYACTSGASTVNWRPTA